MNVVERSSWPLFVVPLAVAIALVGMVVAGAWHAHIGRSLPLTALVVVGFIASGVGAVGGLVLANTRRNVMWILAVALSMTALLALLATVLASFGPT